MDMTLGMLIKLAEEETPWGYTGSMGGETPFSYTGDKDSRAQVQSAPKYTKEQIEELKAAENQGRQDALDRSINIDVPDFLPSWLGGGGHMGFMKPGADLPDYMTGPINPDSWTEKINEAKRRGFNEVAKEHAYDASAMEAQVASIVPDIESKAADRIYGAFTDGRMGAADWDHTKTSTDRIIEFADDTARRTNMNTPQGQNFVANRMALVGKSPLVANWMQEGQQNPDSTMGSVGNALGNVENFVNQAVWQDNLTNLMFVGAPGNLLTFGKMRPGMRLMMPAVVNGAISVVPGEFPEVAKWTGKSKAYEKEMGYRRTYGTAFTNQIADSQFMGQLPDAAGNTRLFSGSNLKPTSWDKSLQFFPDYIKYTEQSKIAPEKFASNSTKFDYVMNRASTGTAGAELFNTPMFLSLRAEQKIKAFDIWLENRYKTSQDFSNMALRAPLSRASMLSRAIATDETGTFQRGIINFLRGSDANTITAYIKSHGGEGTGAADDQEDLLYALRDGLFLNFKDNPDNIRPMMADMLKLSQVEAYLAEKDPSAPAKAAKILSSAFKDALEDPDIVDNMSDEDKQEILAQYMKLNSTENGAALLGSQGAKLSEALVNNFQGSALGAAWKHPEILPDLASAWFASKDMPGMAKAAKNPWIFWGTVGTTLLGGTYLLHKALTSGDDDEDEEDEEDKELKERRRYEKALRRKIYE